MASTFTLTLDTTAPGGVTAIINGDAATTTLQDVTVAVGTSDASTAGYEVLIWGSVDPAADANVQATEAASSWTSYAATKAVRLSSGDGLKTINVRVRDDVRNASAAASDTITLDTTAPLVSITVAPDRTKVSKVAQRDTSIFSWAADSDFVQYEVRVVPATTSARTAGALIGSANGSVNTSGTGAYSANTNVQTTLKGADVEAASTGDGPKIVKVFARDAAGNWST